MLLEAIKSVYQFFQKVLSGDIPIAQLYQIGAAGMIVFVCELFHSLKKDALSLKKLVECIFYCSLAVLLFIMKFLFIGTFLAKEMPSSGLSPSQDDLIWLASCSLAICGCLVPLIRGAIHSEVTAYKVLLGFMHVFILGGLTKGLTMQFHPASDAAIQGYLILAILITLIMYLLVKLEQEMERGEAEDKETQHEVASSYSGK